MDMSDALTTNSMDADATDALDADAFQQLSQNDGNSTTTNTGEIAVDGPPDDLEGPAEQTIEFDSHFSDTLSVVVDVFPFGNAGAPMPGVPPGLSAYELLRLTRRGIWAPFQSKRDWNLARWVKTHSTTSSAVAELLSEHEVCHSIM